MPTTVTSESGGSFQAGVAPALGPGLQNAHPQWVPVLVGGLEAAEGAGSIHGATTVLAITGSKHEELQVAGDEIGVDVANVQIADVQNHVWTGIVSSFGQGDGADLYLVGECSPGAPSSSSSSAVEQTCSGVQVDLSPSLLPASATVSTFSTGRTLEWIGIPGGSS